MNSKITITILLVSFLVICFMVEDSHQFISVLGNRKYNKNKAVDQEKPAEASSIGAKKPGAQRPSGLKSLPFGRRKPDRYPEGPMSDMMRSRHRSYNF